MADTSPKNFSSRRRSPALLATVRCAAEMRVVLESNCPVGVLDVKEPAFGPLGRPSQDELLRIISVTRQWTRPNHSTPDDPRRPSNRSTLDSGPSSHPRQRSRRPGEAQTAPECLGPFPMALSLAAGELHELEQIAGAELDSLRDCLRHFDFVKIGLAGEAAMQRCRDDWPRRLLRCSRRLGIRNLIIAAYADFKTAEAPRLETIVEAAVGMECAGLLVDTAEKRRGTNLFSHLSGNALSHIGNRLRTLDRLFAIAGSLSQRDLADASACDPDLIGMRGGICRDGQRSGMVDVRKLRSAASALNRMAEWDAVRFNCGEYRHDPTGHNRTSRQTNHQF